MSITRRIFGFIAECIGGAVAYLLNLVALGTAFYAFALWLHCAGLPYGGF